MPPVVHGVPSASELRAAGDSRITIDGAIRAFLAVHEGSGISASTLRKHKTFAVTGVTAETTDDFGEVQSAIEQHVLMATTRDLRALRVDGGVIRVLTLIP